MKTAKTVAIVLGLVLFIVLAAFGNAAEMDEFNYAKWWNALDLQGQALVLNGVLEGLQLSAVCIEASGDVERAKFLVWVVAVLTSMEVEAVITYIDEFYKQEENTSNSVAWALISLLQEMYKEATGDDLEKPAGGVV